MKKPRKPRAKSKRSARGVALPKPSLRARPTARHRVAFTSAVRSWVEVGVDVGLRLQRCANRGLGETRDLARLAREVEFKPFVEEARRKAKAVALSYSADEREVFALLFLPFLLLASAMVMKQSMERFAGRFGTIAEAPRTAEDLRREAIAALRPVPINGRPVEEAPLVGLGPGLLLRGNDDVAAQKALVAPDTRLAAADPFPQGDAISGAPVTSEAPSVAGRVDAVVPAKADGLRANTPLVSELSSAQAIAPFAPEIGVRDSVAVLVPPVTVLPVHRQATVALPSVAWGEAVSPVGDVLELAMWDEGETPSDFASRHVCVAEPKQAAMSLIPPANSGLLTAQEFGARLAQAAQNQVEGFVVYNDAYRTISYPNGDVSDLFGVCTDVVVRAYRALGLDLQVLVQQARVGTGDRNIDHRRTEVLRRFFAAKGESLPITEFPEDYLPGDVVSYYRPQNQHTRSHIAIVSSVMAPSGRLMIIHNRGWGPQLEDALFVDQITGHYRYRGTPDGRAEATAIEGSGSSRKASVPSPTFASHSPLLREQMSGTKEH